MQRSAHRLWVGGITVMTALALAGGAMAQTGPGGGSEPAATDNRRLSGEPASTQAMFTSVWGGQAAAEWVKEHNAAISGQAPAPAAAQPAAPAAPTTVPPIAADTTQQTLTRVPIPPIQGKTASIDILEID